MNEVLALVRSALNSAYIDLFKVNLKGQAFSKYFASVPWLDTLFLLGLHIGSLSMVVEISLILFSIFHGVPTVQFDGSSFFVKSQMVVLNFYHLTSFFFRHHHLVGGFAK